MHKTLLLIACWLLCQGVSAQTGNPAQTDTAIRSIGLDEITVKSIKPDQLGNKAKSSACSIWLSPTPHEGLKINGMDFTYWSTKFTQPEEVPITLMAVTTKLRRFDTTQFYINLLILQIRDNDTLKKLVRINGGDIDRKDNLKVLLYNEQIILQPGTFYIGCGFIVKKDAVPSWYHLYGARKGEGAIITLYPGLGVIISPTAPQVPGWRGVRPFNISYRKS